MESVETKEYCAVSEKDGAFAKRIGRKIICYEAGGKPLGAWRYDTGYQYPKTAFYAVWRIRQYAFRIASASGLSVLRDAFRG